MDSEEIDTIAVLGAGTMGHGIAEVAALGGFQVRLRDINEELVDQGYEQIEWSLGKLVEQGQIGQTRADAALDRVEPVVEMSQAVENVDLVIEAVPERLEIKRDVFSEASKYAPKETIFATNTSSLSVTEIGAATDRPALTCGMHFFNPPVKMELVEVIAGDETTSETLDTIVDLSRAFEKTPIRVEKDTPGFVVNRVLVPMLNEATWLVYENEATMQTVDATARYELGLPMGAFELTDQVGIDVALDVLEYVHSELGSKYEPCPLLSEKVESGELGKKTEIGFYDYRDEKPISIQRDAADPDLADRLLAIMANEVGALVGDSVTDLDSIDTALKLGAGFPEGPAAQADAVGVKVLGQQLKELDAASDSDRYQISDGFAEVIDRGGFRVDQNGDASGNEMSDFETLRIERPTEYVGSIVLDRQHRLNALTPTVLEEIPIAVEQLEEMDDVRAIFLRGAGDRAFSVGADIQAMSEIWGDPHGAIELSRAGQKAFGRLQESTLPVIAAIDGYCLGGGMELATAADIRIAATGATFGQPERDLGLLPAWGGTQRLAQVIGEGPAKEIILTGERYDANEMSGFGFVSEVVDREEFTERSLDLAESIAEGPPIALGHAKRAMNVGRSNREAGLEVEAQAFGHLITTDDLNEGVSAFLEDRDPEFSGK